MLILLTKEISFLPLHNAQLNLIEREKSITYNVHASRLSQMEATLDIYNSVQSYVQTLLTLLVNPVVNVWKGKEAYNMY